jgi:hypothetical protein
MALTTLDPNPALIVIDLQKGIATRPRSIPPERSSSGLPAWPTRSAVRLSPSCWST